MSTSSAPQVEYRRLPLLGEERDPDASSEESLDLWLPPPVRRDPGRACNRLLAAAAVLAALTAVALIAVLLATQRAPVTSARPVSVLPISLGSSRWLFDDHAMEGGVQTRDLNGDGQPDLVLPLTLQDRRLAALNAAADSAGQPLEPDDACRRLGLRTPCLGRVVALDGASGRPLWTAATRQAPFELSLDALDANADGRPDCLVSGRRATLAAVEGRSGRVLWRLERSSAVQRRLSVYRPLVLSDLNGDSVPDLLIVQGGDSDYRPEEHQRAPATLCLISGRTGKLLAKCLEVPDRHESYMSPVLLARTDRQSLLLYGTGGETVRGTLYALPWKNLEEWYNRQTFVDPATQLKLWSAPIWNSSMDKGFSVPPLVVRGADGNSRLLIIGFDGVLTALDAKSMQPLWTNTQYMGWETYSSPVSGNFNGDDVPDFGVQLAQGSWPNYRLGLTAILDGRTGTVLWKELTTGADMTSPLLVRTASPISDLFVFRLKGQSPLKARRWPRHVDPPEPHSDNYRRLISSMVCGEDGSEDEVRLVVVTGGQSPSMGIIAVFKDRDFHYNIKVTPRLKATTRFSMASKQGLVDAFGAACARLRSTEMENAAIVVKNEFSFTVYVPVRYRGHILDDDLGVTIEKSQVILSKVVYKSNVRLLPQTRQTQLEYLQTSDSKA